MSRPRIVCVVGPTASGKTEIGVAIAEAVGGEIVAADSRQVYRGFDIGTAKPSAAERARARHHCVDLVEPDDTFDVARFRAAAAAAIADIRRRGRAAIVVGGTGLYVRALLGGLCPAPPRVPAVRAVLAQLAHVDGAPALHRRLVAVDPTAAARIAPHDVVRSVRALEVALTTGRRLSEWQDAHRFRDAPYDALVIGLARPGAELAGRIEARARAMVAGGFLEEVRTLRARVSLDAPAFRAVGYREMLDCVAGDVDFDVALDAMVRATRRFAKRQRTWFRAESAVVWRHPGDDARIVAEVAAFLDGASLQKH